MARFVYDYMVNFFTIHAVANGCLLVLRNALDSIMVAE